MVIKTLDLELDQNPDPHWDLDLDPEQQFEKMLDPDPHYINTDPQPCVSLAPKPLPCPSDCTGRLVHVLQAERGED